MTRFYKKILPAVFTFAVFISHAQNIRVFDFSTERSNQITGTTGSYNLNGGLMVDAKSKLLNLSNFGASGKVKNRIIISQPVAGNTPVTRTVLDNYDIVYIPALFTPLNAAELDALYNWSLVPGNVIITGEQSGYSGYTTKCGYSLQHGNTDPSERIANGDDKYKIFNGIFGNVSARGVKQSGTQQGYLSSDCYSRAIGKNAAGNTTVICNIITNDIYFSNGGFFTNMIGENTVSVGSAIINNSDIMWANTWAWAIREVLDPSAPEMIVIATYPQVSL